MMLVTLQQASDHLRRDTTDDDNDLLFKIEAASEAVINYLGVGADQFLTSAGHPIVDSAGIPIGIPRQVQMAVLIMVGYLYKDRDSDQEVAVSRDFEPGFLPRPVTALLFPLRGQVFS